MVSAYHVSVSSRAIVSTACAATLEIGGCMISGTMVWETTISAHITSTAQARPRIARTRNLPWHRCILQVTTTAIELVTSVLLHLGPRTMRIARQCRRQCTPYLGCLSAVRLSKGNASLYLAELKRHGFRCEYGWLCKNMGSVLLSLWVDTGSCTGLDTEGRWQLSALAHTSRSSA